MTASISDEKRVKGWNQFFDWLEGDCASRTVAGRQSPSQSALSRPCGRPSTIAWDPLLEDGSCDHEWVGGGEGAWPICGHCGERAPDDYGEPCYEDDQP